MKVVTPEIAWHEREPIYSVDLQPLSGSSNLQRLASCGVDRVVRMWRVRVDAEGKAAVEFLSNLSRHSATVNVCRFSPDGKLLATGADDAVILLWKLSDVPVPANNIFSEEDTENKETWVVHKTLRGHLGDVYDLCWSSDSRYIISGSVDNSAIAWDTQKDVKLALFNEHKSYVQGVAWDPMREYIATLSSDRSCRIYNLSTKHCIHNVSKIVPRHAAANAPEGTKPKAVRLFHDDTLRSFFRRLAFSPDGQLLITPAGLMESGEKQISATFVFVRGTFKEPAAYLPSANKASVAVRVCPCLFELRQVPKKSATDTVNDGAKEWEKYSTVFCLPYRVVFAVATEDSVVLYDSQQTLPFAYLANIHYHTLSDLTWSHDGRILVVSSTDGYCSVVTFDAGELGVPYTPRPASPVSTATKVPPDPQSMGDQTTQKLPTPSSNLNTTGIASEKKVDVEADSKPSCEQKPSDTTAVDASSTTTKPPPCSPPQIKPSTAAEVAPVMDIKNISISPSGSPMDSMDKGTDKGTAVTSEKGVDQAGQGVAKQPKRIQFKTLTLLKPK